MKNVKYNPFRASSVLMAILMYIVFTQQKHDVEFEMDKDAKKDEDVLAFFEKHQALAKKDTQYSEYPARSIFREKNIPLLLWAVSNEEKAKGWRPGDSENIEAAIICSYSNLTNPEVLKELSLRLSMSSQDTANFNALIIRGQALIRSGMYDIMQNEVVQEVFLKEHASAKSEEAIVDEPKNKSSKKTKKEEV